MAYQRKPDKNYNPVALDVNQAPPPFAPTWLKQEVYTDVRAFGSLDNHAMAVAQVEHQNFRHLLWNLLGDLKFDVEKLRVLYRWLAAKNMSAVKFDSEAPGSVEDAIVGLRTKRSTYAKVFQLLCNYSGIPCITVSGLAKGADFRPGMKVVKGSSAAESSYNHSWNAVYLEGCWQLIDCQWATRYVQSEGAKGTVVYDYNDYYFLTPPHQLVYSHWPYDPRWQLLRKPLSIEEFEALPLAKSCFFHDGMQFVTHNKGVIHTSSGYVRISLGLPDNQPLAYTYKLALCDTLKEEHHGIHLTRYVLQEIADNKVNYYVRIPAKGQYFLTIFAQQMVPAAGRDMMVFHAACEYRIVSDKAVPNVEPYPECADSSWGVGPAAIPYGLVPTNKGGTVCTTIPEAKIKFNKTRPVDVIFRMQKPGVPDSTLEQYVQVQDAPTHCQGILQLPAKGEYGVEVYANDPAKDGKAYTHVGQYMVRYGDPEHAASAPNYYNAYHHEDPRHARDHGKFGPEYGVHVYEGYTPDPSRLPEAGKYNPVIEPVEGSRTEMQHGQPDPYSRDPSVGVVPDKAYTQAFAITDQSKRPSGQQAAVAPENFTVTPVRSQEKPPPVPPPPAPELLEQYDRHKAAFENVDKHAYEVARVDHSTFRDLVWDLIYSRNITDDLERVRAIFQWLCTKNLQDVQFSGKVASGSPEEVLLGLKKGTSTYAHIFQTLCSYAELHCVPIHGYAKGADYQPGMKFDGSGATHTWNAVLVNGHWRLFDPHWAARRIVGKKSQENIQYQLDEYYFCTSPKQLIYTHFPHEAEWQLLERRISLAEFELLPPVKSLFFRYGLEMLSHRQAVIHCNGDVNVQIGFMRYHGTGLDFSFTLSFEKSGETFQGEKLNKYGLHEAVDMTALFRLRFPAQESYRLVIFAREVNPAESVKDRGTYGAVIEYKVVCDKLTWNPPPYPPCSGPIWGLPDTTNRFQIESSEHRALIFTKDGQCELQFNLPRTLIFMAKLKSHKIPENVLDSHIMHRVVRDIAVFSVSVPERGEYGLDIFCSDPATDGKTLFHYCQYLIICEEERVSGMRFPQLPTAYLGPQPGYHNVQMEAISHVDPYILCESGEEDIQFVLGEALKITSSLADADTGIECSEYVLQQKRDNLITFVVRPPKHGLFKFQIYAQSVKVASDSIPGIYNYLVNAQVVIDDCAPFPKQYSHWKERCCLYTPVSGVLTPRDLDPNGNLFFKLDAPEAKRVAVILGQEWHQLTQTSTVQWQGSVPVTADDLARGGRMSVTANFSADAQSFNTLLEYGISN